MIIYPLPPDDKPTRLQVNRMCSPQFAGSQSRPETIDSFKQSILPIAIEQNHFEFARKWIGLMEKQERLNLQHMDRFGRNALMTALGCFFRDFPMKLNPKIDKKN